MDEGKLSAVENVRKASELVLLLDQVAKVASGSGELAGQLATDQGKDEGELFAKRKAYMQKEEWR